MPEWQAPARTLRLLASVHPKLQVAVLELLQQMADIGLPMVVTDGNRTTEEQQALYALGRTKPGKIVTHADGVRKKSNHQGGRAVDCTFLNDKGQPHWPDGPADQAKWQEYGTRAKALGLIWGGEFKSIKDKPHIELPKENR